MADGGLYGQKSWFDERRPAPGVTVGRAERFCAEPQGWREGTTLEMRRQAMTKSNAIFVGLDVHKESIDIALAASAARGEVRHYGTIGGSVVTGFSSLDA